MWSCNCEGRVAVGASLAATAAGVYWGSSACGLTVAGRAEWLRGLPTAAARPGRAPLENGQVDPAVIRRTMVALADPLL